MNKIFEKRINNKGFTLIELLVVIAIISVLASLLMANFVGVRQRGRDAQRKSDMRQIQSALELYRADNGSYPDALPTCGTPLTFTDGATTVTYMQKVPCDPLSEDGYYYTAGTAPAITYEISSCIENENDSDRDDSGDTIAECSTSTNISYTLTNP